MPPYLVIKVKWSLGLHLLNLSTHSLLRHSLLYSFIPLVVFNACCMSGLLYSQSVPGTARKLRAFTESSSVSGPWEAEEDALGFKASLDYAMVSCLIKPKGEEVHGEEKPKCILYRKYHFL